MPVNCIRTSVARTLMAGQPCLTGTRSWVPTGHFIKTNPGWLELPLAGTYFHGPKPVRATKFFFTLLKL